VSFFAFLRVLLKVVKILILTRVLHRPMFLWAIINSFLTSIKGTSASLFIVFHVCILRLCARQRSLSALFILAFSGNIVNFEINIIFCLLSCDGVISVSGNYVLSSEFKSHIFNAWGWSVRPEHVALWLTAALGISLFMWYVKVRYATTGWSVQNKNSNLITFFSLLLSEIFHDLLKR